MFGIYHNVSLSPIVKPQYSSLSDAQTDIANRLKHWFTETTMEIAEPKEIETRMIMKYGRKAVRK